MHLLATLLASSALISTAFSQFGQVNTSREYNLKTCLKPGQSGKDRFENLWLEGYHTGAGENDATFDAERSNVTARGFLAPVTNSTVAGDNFSEFDLGTPPFPWTMVMAENVNFYAAWQPVRINAGGGSSTDDQGIDTGFFINGTGLQWTSSAGNAGSAQDEFGGWLICEWWHGVPQLFFRNKYYNTPELYSSPCSCADVYLIPEYL